MRAEERCRLRRDRLDRERAACRSERTGRQHQLTGEGERRNERALEVPCVQRTDADPCQAAGRRTPRRAGVHERRSELELCEGCDTVGKLRFGAPTARAIEEALETKWSE